MNFRKILFIAVFIAHGLFISPVRADHLGLVSNSCPLTMLNGESAQKLGELKGKVIYIDFWASWCPPCVKSFPFMNQLNNELKDQGLHVIGVNLDEKVSDAEKFLERYPAQFSVVADPSKQCAKELQVMAMPTSVIIDKNGKIRHIHKGFRPDESEKLRSLVTELLQEAPENN
ncbi:MAG: TlpA family protein disulfide reductase [Nitrosomonas sp.]|nr:TlpA family protein disulfide reductase [Nitrosomonas sp.]